MSKSQLLEDSDGTSKCSFTSILRRLVCAGGLRTHPSTDTDADVHHLSIKLLQPTGMISNKINTSTPTPTPAAGNNNIVARLMGLDSLPPNTTTSSSIIMRKSRSLGSMPLVHFSPHLTKHHHRRSISFREQLTYPTSSLDILPINKPFITTTTTSTRPIQDDNSKQIREEARLVKTNAVNNYYNKQKINSNKKHQSQRVMNKLLVKNEQQQLSTHVPLKIITRKRGAAKNSRKKLLIDGLFLEARIKPAAIYNNHNHPLIPNMDTEDHYKRSTIKRSTKGDCIKMLVQVYRLTMVDIQEAAGVWMDTKLLVNNTSSNLQQISYDIAQQILQLLLYEMVDDLCASMYN